MAAQDIVVNFDAARRELQTILEGVRSEELRTILIGDFARLRANCADALTVYNTEAARQILEHSSRT